MNGSLANLTRYREQGEGNAIMIGVDSVDNMDNVDNDHKNTTFT